MPKDTYSNRTSGQNKDNRTSGLLQMIHLLTWPEWQVKFFGISWKSPTSNKRQQGVQVGVGARAGAPQRAGRARRQRAQRRRRRGRQRRRQHARRQHAPLRGRRRGPGQPSDSYDVLTTRAGAVPRNTKKVHVVPLTLILSNTRSCLLLQAGTKRQYHSSKSKKVFYCF